jgi:hypothetical protein
MNGVAVVSLVLCLAMAVLGVVSIWYECKTVVGVRPYAVLSHSRLGEMSMAVMTEPTMPTRFAVYATASRVEPLQWKYSRILGSGWGFAARHDVRVRPGLLPMDLRVIVVPHWVLGIVFAIPVAWRWWPRRGKVAGVCAGCGYDLRATPERCPECGRGVGV